MQPRRPNTRTKYFLLEEGDEIQPGDERYDPIEDNWAWIWSLHFGSRWDPKYWAPVRRRNQDYKNEEIINDLHAK